MNDFNLDNEPKIKSGFSVPEHYFDGFSEKVLQQLLKGETKVISIGAKPASIRPTRAKSNKKWLYAVAAVLVLSLSIPFIYNTQKDGAEASNAAIENYLSYHSTLTDYDLVELLDKEDLDKITVTDDIEDAVMEDVLTENSNLEHYITN